MAKCSSRLIPKPVDVTNANSPVSKVEEREDQREEDSRNDINSLGASRELGQPQAATVQARRLPLDLALTHLWVQYTKLDIIQSGNSPVGEIEERKYEREGDPGDNVYPLRASRELGHPESAAVLARRLHVDLTLAHLGVHRAADQGLLSVADRSGWKNKVNFGL